jgi:thiamine-phosphate pyrophosphorylase
MRLNAALRANTQGCWDQLPQFAQSVALAHSDLAVPHPQAGHHLQSGLSLAPTATPLVHEVYLGALALGFEREDATLLGLAWQRQSQRLGRIDKPSPQTWPDEWADFSPEPWQREAFAPCPNRLGLYVVAPSAEWIARLVDMGVPTVQLRFKSDNPKAVEREVKAAIHAARGSASHLYINDFWPLAIEHGAYGVHLGQEDVDGADFEAIRRAGLRLGLSTHGYSEMLRAAHWRPSYLALGAVYATNLKVMPTQPQGPARLQRYAALMAPQFPLVAIGGIDRDRLSTVLTTQVGSVAAVRAILNADDPAQEARAWMQRCPASH